MCVDMTDRCDWHFDCADKSDEKGCAEWKKCAFGKEQRERKTVKLAGRYIRDSSGSEQS